MLWEESGLTNPDTAIAEGYTKRDAPTFSIVLPPPNVTGTLHTGHAAMLAIEDIMVRYKRMRGFRTLWIPGTDSAAIATQSKVEGDIYKKERKTRHDIGREELLRRIEEFTTASKKTIVEQTKHMGASLDWGRYAYTMDEKRSTAVTEAFVRMYGDGLIYRGNRIVNWDPKLQTTVSDDEIEYIEQKDRFYHFKYGPFEIGTVRPETKFGDKYVVMHPDDARYKKYSHGQAIELEWINGPIMATIIKDSAVDMEFGSGVMTITPSHSGIDFEIAMRHGLDIERVIDDRGILLPIAGEFAGMHIMKARPLIIEKLQKKGLIAKVNEEYVHSIATNSRGGGIIEPQVKEQWFVAVNKDFLIKNSKISAIPSGSTTTLKKLMHAAVESGEITIMPERFRRVYYHWIDNLRDWCISRQIWFGHRIPAWHHDTKCIGIEGREADVRKCIPIIVSAQKPICKFCAAEYIQDPDTLDTWFSSGLWTFSTLGWPEDTDDLRVYHPTSVLETGYDILFFWVARMVLMSGYLLGDIPFKIVYLHGLVRDEHGRKMSKSLGNIVDPLDKIAEFGADALRMALIVGIAPGNDNNLSDSKIKAYKLFANKLWNIARFVCIHTPEESLGEAVRLTPHDEGLLRELTIFKESITRLMDEYKFYLASEMLYHYIWHTFADEIIEVLKPRLGEDSPTMDRASAQFVLERLLRECLVMLHPFMPHITEELWHSMPEQKGLLMVQSW